MWLYVVFEEHIRFGHVCGNYMFPVTWCWWCHQWHHCFCDVEVIVCRYYMTFGASANSSACWHQCHVPFAIPFGIMWCWCQWHHMIKKSFCTSFQSCSSMGQNGAIDDAISIDTIASANGIIWLKDQLALYFGCLYIRNVVMPLASCDTDTCYIDIMFHFISFVWTKWM